MSASVPTLGLSGSWTLRDMKEEKEKRRRMATEGAQDVAKRKAARMERAQDNQERQRVRLQAFMVCNPNCSCGVEPCPWLEFRYCESCSNLKKGWCKKRKCVDLRKGAVSVSPVLHVDRQGEVTAVEPAPAIGADA